jgi:DUF971 family protein
MQPNELRLNTAKDLLTVVWPDTTAELRAEYLRVESPSAEVKGHGLGQGRLVSGKAAVLITSLTPVGAYAVKIGFNDGHATGLYTWTYLRELFDEEPVRWAAYVQDLGKAGLNRDKAGPVVLRANLA